MLRLFRRCVTLTDLPLYAHYDWLERGEALSGNKAWLRRRLHVAIVSEYLESAAGAARE